MREVMITGERENCKWLFQTKELYEDFDSFEQ